MDLHGISNQLISHFTACLPYTSEDPFIIKECPHVYFAGNQPRFQKKVVQGKWLWKASPLYDKHGLWVIPSPLAVADGRSVLLICVPNFDFTHSCVLVNLRSLECQEIKFGTSLETTPNPELTQQMELEGEGSVSLYQEPQEEMSILHHMDEDDNDED